MSFDPKPFMIRVQGGREYLPVAARLVWFRGEHSDWGIVTEPLEINQEMQYAIFRASIFNEEGRLIATATKREDVRGFADWLEKAETGAVGRALALCGYGTQFAPEMDEGERLADAPRPARERPPSPARQAWIDAAGAAGALSGAERGQLLNEMLGRPLDCREPVSEAQYREALEALRLRQVETAAPVRDEEGILADPFAEEETPGALFPETTGRRSGLTPTGAIAGGL